MPTNPRDRSEVADGIRRQFPETGETILTLATLTYFSNGPMAILDNEFDGLIRGDSEADLSDEGVAKALNSLAGGFNVPTPSGRHLALDYRGPYGEPARFSGYVHDFDTRPRMDVVLLVSPDDGWPQGLIPLPEGTGDMRNVCEYLKDFDGTIVTDRLPYDDVNIRALDRWGVDWLLTEPPFPQTAAAVNPKMSHLKHGDREYETCKVRYDKHWLFRFTDPAEREEARRAVQARVRDRHEADRLSKAAGITDAISSQSYDIRKVREMLDVRAKCDEMMRRQWRQMSACSTSNRNNAFVTLCLQVLAEMLR